jgi:rhamnosyltransferase subunit B
MATVVMVVTGTAGDIHPLVAIGGGLTARGHRCTLISHAPYAGRARAAGLEFVPVDTPEEYKRLLRASAELVTRNHDADARRRVAGWYHNATRAKVKFDEVTRRVGSDSSVVIARYVTETDAINAAQAAGVVAAWSLVSPHAVDEARGIDQLHGGAYLDALNIERHRFGLAPVDSWLSWVEASPRLGLWPYWFAPDMENTPGLYTTGFPDDLGRPLPADIWQFLGDGVPPVLVTAGSGMMLAPGFHRAAVEGALRAGFRVLAVGGEPGLMSSRWDSRVEHRQSLPLTALIPHVAAVVHHGGIGTVARCLEAGVPQLVLAQGVDRPDNAARAQRLGVAIAVPHAAWRPAEVAQGLRRLCDESQHRQKAAEWAAVMGTNNGVASACDRIEELLN